MLRGEEGEKRTCSSHLHRGNLAEGFQTFCSFQGDVCLPKIPGSSRPGRSIRMRLVFMLKELCDAISIHDEPPALLISNRRQLSLPTIYTAVFVPE